MKYEKNTPLLKRVTLAVASTSVINTAIGTATSLNPVETCNWEKSQDVSKMIVKESDSIAIGLCRQPCRISAEDGSINLTASAACVESCERNTLLSNQTRELKPVNSSDFFWCGSQGRCSEEPRAISISDINGHFSHGRGFQLPGFNTTGMTDKTEECDHALQMVNHKLANILYDTMHTGYVGDIPEIDYRGGIENRLPSTSLVRGVIEASEVSAASACNACYEGNDRDTKEENLEDQNKNKIEDLEKEIQKLKTKTPTETWGIISLLLSSLVSTLLLVTVLKNKCSQTRSTENSETDQNPILETNDDSSAPDRENPRP